jgi:hypothetical protein
VKRGPKPTPTALRRLQGNPGKRAWNHDEPVPPADLPTCPDHLNAAARDEWERLASVLHEMGVVTLVDDADAPENRHSLCAAVALALDRQQATGTDGTLHGRAWDDACVALADHSQQSSAGRGADHNSADHSHITRKSWCA